jgi:UbiD family decarboxylase
MLKSTVAWRNLGEYVKGLEEAGKLVRVTVPINKDTELHPLVRLQFRGLPESERKAFLFENIHDALGKKYDIPVLIAALAGSAEIYSLGMGCPISELDNEWQEALAHPLEPIHVDEAPCQEVRITGAELQQPGGGLSRLPVPISTPGFDNAPYTTGGHWISKDPNNEMHNVGNYRGMVKAEDRIGVLPGMLGVGMSRHIDMWRAKGAERMPAAIVIGAPPHVTYTAVTRIPNDMCEYDVAGALSHRPLELVRCLTQDIYVPAEAEIVIEGTVPTNILEIEGAFGEFPGYMAQRDYSYFMEVTAITMRRKPTYLAIISQLPPSESSKMRHIGRSAGALKMLINEGFSNALDVNYFECGGANAIVAVKIKKVGPDDGKNILRALTTKFIGKIAIVVDEDINIYDLENVMWAVAFRSQPYRDVEIIDVPSFPLDPSAVAPGQPRGNVDGRLSPRSSGLLIDATMPWPYPPLSLPKREYMERAITIWNDLKLPTLNLKEPWFGHALAYWTPEEDEEATLAMQGRHFETGDKLKKSRRTHGASGENGK